MRKHATLGTPVNGVVRLMLCDDEAGVYLFEYPTLADGPCGSDAVFETREQAENEAARAFGVKPEDWVPIPDRVPGCQQDWIAPVRVRGRDTGNPEWGVFERRFGVSWEPVPNAPLEDEMAEVAQFARAAQAFRDWCRGHHVVSGGSEIRVLVALLAELVGRAVLLPPVEPTAACEACTGSVTLPAITVAEVGMYWEIFDALEGLGDASAPEVVLGDLAEDLGDIYREVAEGLVCWEAGSDACRREAAWRWKFSFESHWGEHATGALRALYWCLRRASVG